MSFLRFLVCSLFDRQASASLTNAHMYTPSATPTTIASSVCRKCGTINKSGKSSCCGRGGSWFRNCGGAGNANVDHTWYEGIQACKAQSQTKAVIKQKANVARQNGNDSFLNDVDMVNSKSAITATGTWEIAAHISLLLMIIVF